MKSLQANVQKFIKFMTFCKSRSVKEKRSDDVGTCLWYCKMVFNPAYNDQIRFPGIRLLVSFIGKGKNDGNPYSTYILSLIFG